MAKFFRRLYWSWTRRRWSVQPADGPEVQVQLRRPQIEPFGNLTNRLLELHQRQPDILELLGSETFGFQPPDCLALHQLAYELDEAQNELDDRFLHIFRVGVPA